MQLMDIIRNRRSIRRYQARRIEREKLDMIVEATFAQPGMRELLDKWGLDADYMPIAFVCLGYIDGAYPKTKARSEGRYLYVGEGEA